MDLMQQHLQDNPAKQLCCPYKVHAGQSRATMTKRDQEGARFRSSFFEQGTGILNDDQTSIVISACWASAEPISPNIHVA